MQQHIQRPLQLKCRFCLCMSPAFVCCMPSYALAHGICYPQCALTMAVLRPAVTLPQNVHAGQHINFAASLQQLSAKSLRLCRNLSVQLER